MQIMNIYLSVLIFYSIWIRIDSILKISFFSIFLFFDFLYFFGAHTCKNL